MEVVLFYLFSLIAIISSIGVILSVFPVYALLYLVISMLSVSFIFFILGAYFAGALEVIIYAGAIVVLFVFVMMLLNINAAVSKNRILFIRYNFKTVLLVLVFLMIFLFFIWSDNNNFYVDCGVVRKEAITLKSVGISLFGSYIVLVEMASILLLAALVISLHIGRVNMKYNIRK